MPSHLDTSEDEEEAAGNPRFAAYEEAIDTEEEEEQRAQLEDTVPTRPQRQRKEPDRLGEWVSHRVKEGKGMECCYDSTVTFV